MRVGLYGGMANNMYVFAKALASQGVEVRFIRDRDDRYPFSQPIWEDASFRMTHDEVIQAASWTWGKWTAKERELKWNAPGWLFDPFAEQGSGKVSAASDTKGTVDRLYMRRYLRVHHRSSVLGIMQSCDALLVCGIEGSLLAARSGRPYIIWPHGGDTMIAAGMFRPGFLKPRARFIHEILRRQLVAAYDHAICLGSHEPTGICADYLGAENFVRRQKIGFVPIPIPVRPRPDAGTRRRMLKELLMECGADVPESRYIGFVPSRVDYRWKGHDRLLGALGQLGREGIASDFHLVFSGWGSDFGKARRYVEENNLSARMTLLNCALSKPLLFRFFQSADFVVDQFVMGLYGTAALEAMACGAPLIMWINDSYERPWGAPPVIQARTTEDIATVFRDMEAGQIDLEEKSRSLQKWMGRVHHPQTVVPSLMAMYQKA